MRKLILAIAALPTALFAQATSNNRASPTVTGSFVLTPTSAYLTGLNITSGATAGYILLYDAASAPADGAVTPARCLPLAANTGTERTFPTPIWYRNGITVVFSSTGCFTQTTSATAFIAGDFK